MSDFLTYIPLFKHLSFLGRVSKPKDGTNRVALDAVMAMRLSNLNQRDDIVIVQVDFHRHVHARNAFCQSWTPWFVSWSPWNNFVYSHSFYRT